MEEYRKSSRSLRGVIPKNIGSETVRRHLSQRRCIETILLKGWGQAQSAVGPAWVLRPIIQLTVRPSMCGGPCSESALISSMSPLHSFPRLLPPQPSTRAHCTHPPTARHWRWSWEVTGVGVGGCRAVPRNLWTRVYPPGLEGEQRARPSGPNLSGSHDLEKHIWLLHAAFLDEKTVIVPDSKQRSLAWHSHINLFGWAGKTWY